MKRHLAVLFAATAVLAACGGGDGEPAPSPAPPTAPAPAPVSMVPDSVNASIANFIGYLTSLVTVTDEGSEPLDLSAVTPPLSETAEPTATP